MSFRLRDGVSFCVLERRTIFLDIDADRYFGIPQSTEAAFRKLVEGSELSAQDLQTLQPLSAQALLQSCSPSAPLQSEVVDVAEADTVLDTGPVSVRHLIIALCWQLSASMTLKVGSFQAIIRRLKSPKGFGSRHLSEAERGRRAFQVASAHDAVGRILSRQDQCLRNAIALRWALAWAGVDAKLVLGVKVGPFEAHSWVQFERAVLNDYLDRVREYRPIVAV